MGMLTRHAAFRSDLRTSHTMGAVCAPLSVDTVLDSENKVPHAIKSTPAIPPKTRLASITELMSIIVLTPFLCFASSDRVVARS